MLPIEGQRVRLRRMTPDDVTEYRSWMHPGAAWKAFDGPFYPLADTEGLDAESSRLRRWIANNYLPDPWRRATIADKQTDRFLGTVTRYWISSETRWPALGISLYDQATWGQGLGTEALALWIAVVFAAHPDIVRVDLRTWSGNIGMVRVAEKLGFACEAVFRKARIVDGEYYDALAFGLLREEWGG